MRTKFTLEEIYEAWSEAILLELCESYDMPRSVAYRMILMYGLKEKFMENPEKYDYIEVETMAWFIYDVLRK